MAFKTGDRVIYDDCPCLVMDSKSLSPINRLYPIEWDKGYPYIDIWINEDFISLDKQYYRNKKINELINE